MAITLITDSAADFELHELKEKNIISVPMTITFGEHGYHDGIDLSKSEFYAKLSDGVYPSTAQPSPLDFLKHFKKAKEAGNSVVAILLSSSLSGTVQSANIAKNMLGYDDIYIIDSLSAVTGQRMLVDIANQMRADGELAGLIAEKIEELKHRLKIIAIVDTLRYLYEGGRLSKAQAMIGNIAHLKPIISVHADGKVTLAEKCIGTGRAMKKLISIFEGDYIDHDYPVYFPYSHNISNCSKLFDTVKDRHPGLEKNFYNLGPTIGSHIGENAFGFTYILGESK